uniref:DUF4372 domain-containing protein n=1 Tax=Ascaris lumbricoides TaxID=6252 RepID=A0A0M3I1K5_ASCLU
MNVVFETLSERERFMRMHQSCQWDRLNSAGAEKKQISYKQRLQMVLFLEQGASAVDAKWKYPLVAEMKSDALTGNVIRTMEEAFDTNGRLSECAFAGGFRLPESHKQVSCLLWSRVWIAHQCLHHYFGLQGPFAPLASFLGTRFSGS